MTKKQGVVSLRKPPSKAVDAFVLQGRGASAEELEASLGDVRALTIHLPKELFHRLTARCLRDDRDVSNVLTELVDHYLEEAIAVCTEPATSVTAKVKDDDLHLASVLRWLRRSLSRSMIGAAFRVVAAPVRAAF
ncbi:MAG: hypothetical protein NVS3B20_01850 [Polyangiales bacterium]